MQQATLEESRLLVQLLIWRLITKRFVLSISVWLNGRPQHRKAWRLNTLSSFYILRNYLQIYKSEENCERERETIRRRLPALGEWENSRNPTTPRAEQTILPDNFSFLSLGYEFVYKEQVFLLQLMKEKDLRLFWNLLFKVLSLLWHFYCSILSKSCQDLLSSFFFLYLLTPPL